MGSVQVKNLMQELKLHGMLEVFERTTESARKENWTGEEFIDQLLNAESSYREGLASERRLKTSKLAKMPMLEDFDYTVKRTFTKEQIKEFYSLRWLEQGRPLVFIGPTGVGKTFLAEALGHHACQMKKQTLFMSVSDLTEHQALARTTGKYLQLRARLCKPDLLLLDDFGLSKLNTQQAHDFCEIIKERTGAKSTIITTQLPFDHWPEVLEDPVIADSIIDRLKHVAITFKVDGETYRKKQGEILDKQLMN